MKYITFMTEVDKENRIEIPSGIRDKLGLKIGDKLEVTVKKIRTRRLDLLISKNPLYKLFKLIE